MRRYLPRVLLVFALAIGVGGACVVKHHPRHGHKHRVRHDNGRHRGHHKAKHRKHKHKKHKHRGHGRGHRHH